MSNSNLLIAFQEYIHINKALEANTIKLYLDVSPPYVLRHSFASALILECLSSISLKGEK